MRKHAIRALALAASAMALGPAGLLAHAGHGGDHSWLAGALRPLMALDHFTAALFVGVLCVGAAWVVARAGRDHLASRRAERDVA
jgi:hydrogenase/urease accessory protein HupE